MELNRQHKLYLTGDDLRYLCDVLQPDIAKGDEGALQLYWEFQAIINPTKEQPEP